MQKQKLKIEARQQL